MAFEGEKIEPLLSAICDTAEAFEVSKDAISWRLKDFGLLDKFFSQGQHEV